MNGKQFAKYVARDLYCLHCGETEAISPQHRANKGIGGSKKREHPANIIVFCSYMNSAIESDSTAAQVARENGWKLSSWDDPHWVPVFDAITGKWWL